jgi:hypothetical protein
MPVANLPVQTVSPNQSSTSRGRRGRKILGLSHLVYFTPDTQLCQTTLTRVGYTVANEQPRAENPPEKQPFIGGTLEPTYAMQLLTHPDKPCPPVELFEVAREPGPQRTVFQLSLRADETNTPGSRPQGGIWIEDGNTGSHRNVEIHLSCTDLDLSMGFIEFLGLGPERSGPDRGRVQIPRGLSGSGYELQLWASEDGAGAAYLDQEGMPCLSMISTMKVSRLAEEMRAAFSDSELLIGEPFTHKPFAKTLDIMFVRVGNGEIYEFLS